MLSTSYRTSEFMRSGISDLRYGRLLTFSMGTPTIWSAAIKRLIASKGLDTGAELIRDAARRGVHLRANTLSDALKNDKPRMDTMVTIARALDVPLWALYCSEQEYAVFTAALEQRNAQATARQSDAEVLAQVIDQLKPTLQAAIAGARSGTLPPAPQPQPEPVPALRVVEKKTSRKVRR